MKLTRVMKLVDDEGDGFIEDYFYDFQDGTEGVCAKSICYLLRLKNPPERLKLTVSDKPMNGAACVPVHLGHNEWRDVIGYESWFPVDCCRYLMKKGFVGDRWIDLWLDCEEV